MASRQPGRGHGWRDLAPELSILALLALATCAAVYGVAGLPVAVLTFLGWAVAALVLLRAVVPATEQPLVDQAEWRQQGRTSFTGFWRQRASMTDAMASSASFDQELRPTLQHLLAARLAERHGVSLYTEPDEARRLFLYGSRAGTAGASAADPQRSRRDEQLWYWLDPARPPSDQQRGPGIPARTLAAIINRLERL